MTLNLGSILKTNGKWLEQQQSSILSAAAIISVANIVSLFAGLLRERLLIGTFFGSETSRLAYEAFKVAFQIPNTMFQIIVLGALSATLVPIFTQQKKRDEIRAFMMSSVIFNYLTLAFIVTSLIVFIFAGPITNLRTGDEFTAEQVTIVVNLTRIMLLSQLFFAISNFLTGILQSYQRFILPALAPIVYNLGILLGVYVFAPMFGIYSAGIGVVIGAFIHMAIQIPLVMKLGFRYQLSFDLSFPGVKSFLKLSPPRTLALALSEIRKLFLGFFATSLGNLSYLVMDYGLSLMAIPIRFFGASIGQASLPFLSTESEDNEREKFKNLLIQSMNQVTFLTYPAAALLLILRVPTIRLVYGAVNFPWVTTVTIGRVVAILAISIVAQSITQLLIRGFYALKDTKTPLLVTTLDAVGYLALSWVFVFWFKWKVIGIALATAITGFTEFFILLWLLSRKVKGLIDKSFWVPQLKMLLVTFFMTVFLYLPFRILDELVFNTTKTVELIALTITTATIGLLVYLYFAALFDVKELSAMFKLINRFGGWQLPLKQTQELLVETPIDNETGG